MAARMIEDVDGVLVPAPPVTVANDRPRVLSRDCYVVETSALAPVVRGFVTAWNRTRPSDAQTFSVAGERRLTASAFSPYAWLEQESGVPSRTLRDIARGSRRRRFTPLGEADAIVTALGRPDLLDGTLVVVANPGCCGSLTGDARPRS